MFSRLATGRRYQRLTLWNANLWRIRDKLKSPRCGLHASRHGRVSFLVENNVPVSVIKSWIGHGSEKMIELYTHSRPEFHQLVLAKLPAIVDPLTHFDATGQVA